MSMSTPIDSTLVASVSAGGRLDCSCWSSPSGLRPLVSNGSAAPDPRHLLSFPSR
jgi:hypothetical protein